MVYMNFLFHEHTVHTFGAGMGTAVQDVEGHIDRTVVQLYVV